MNCLFSFSQRYFVVLLESSLPNVYHPIRSVHWLEDYLRAFRGTVISITHDRYEGCSPPSAKCAESPQLFMQQSSGQRVAVDKCTQPTLQQTVQKNKNKGMAQNRAPLVAAAATVSTFFGRGTDSLYRTRLSLSTSSLVLSLGFW